MLVLGFAGLILAGALLLMTPLALQPGKSLKFIDALFTATSAVCVTGLVVVDTGTHYSVFGQMVILTLIQVGGLGVMTVTTLLAVAAGKKINLRERLLIQEATNQLDLSGVVKLTLTIIKTTLVVEFIGGSILAFRLYQDFGPQGVYFGFWHAVSAFCNAGFDLFGNYTSITSYVDDITVSATVAALIIIGGIGFPVIADVWNYRRTRRLSLHSKIVLLTSLLLIIGGASVVFLAEYTNPDTLGQLPPWVMIMASLFKAITARTAGFNTIDTGALREGTLLFIMLLMFIGASPSSTGGGIKTSTFTVLLCALAASFRSRKDAEVFRRRIPEGSVNKAFILAMISWSWVLVLSMLMSFTEDAPLIKVMFEVFSAFGTVGLSTGITPTLSPVGKALIILTMFAGRVGTVTLIMALILRKRTGNIQYPEGKLLIG
ncbi:MAG: TrkH family potassium uptake protein [Sporomusaceae bacterium]|nr:TrkH family potassium uptake protein [Sporomusaceae bacterium]